MEEPEWEDDEGSDYGGWFDGQEGQPRFRRGIETILSVS